MPTRVLRTVADTVRVFDGGASVNGVASNIKGYLVDAAGGSDTLVVDDFYPSPSHYSISTVGDGILTITMASGTMKFKNFETLKFQNVTVKLGTVANDSIVGSSKNDPFLYGVGGNDNILGGAGNDKIYGGLGNDKINGQTGLDVLSGGAGNDTFVFNTAANAATNKDTVTDFNSVNDTIQLENAIFRTLGGPGALKAAYFYAGAAAHDADDHLIYNKATGALIYDSNGKAAGGAVQIATLSNHAAVSVSDFFVI